MSLSDKTIAIVKATAPAIADKKVEIADCFYKKVFKRNPAVRIFAILYLERCQ